jgi:transcription elongation factor Elf1
MNSCPNCGNPLSCSCQLRTASDGKQVCTNCAAFYEQQLVQQQTQAPGN